MDEYSQRLILAEFVKEVNELSLPFSTIPSVYLTEEEYYYFIETFSKVNLMNGYNYNRIGWWETREIIENTREASNRCVYNGLNINSFTLASRIDSLDIINNEFILKLIRVSEDSSSIWSRNLIGDLIIASFPAYIVAIEFALEKCSVEIITVSSIENPKIIGVENRRFITFQNGRCQLLIDDKTFDITSIVDKGIDQLCE